MKRAFPILLSALALSAITNDAPAQRAIVLDDLTTQPITRLLSLSDRGFETEYPDGAIRQFDTSRARAITQIHSRTTQPQPGTGWIELTDGQRIVGRAAELSSDTEAVAWMHRDFGVIWIPLEQLARLVPPGVSPVTRLQTTSEITSDTVELINGDRLTGYILQAGREITLEDADANTIIIPFDRIASLRLANQPEQARGTYLWLSDGSIFAAQTIIDVTGDRVQVELPTGESAILTTAQILGVVLDAQRLTPLCATPPAVIHLPENRRWSANAMATPGHDSISAPILFARDLLIPGPMTLRWELEPGSTHLGTTVEMPPESFPWGDCEIVVRSGSAEVYRARINEETPRHEIVVELQSTSIEIEIEAGEHGPINDSVLLIAPMILRENQ